MLEWLSSADPGRVHTEGRMARVALEEARSELADFFGTRPRQVIFTSGATESINSAVYGALAHRPGGVVVAAVEHSAVQDASARWGSTLVQAAVDKEGRIDAASVAAAVAAGGVALVHCQLANHEVGTIQPVSDIVSSKGEALVHVDAAAGAGYIPIRFDDLGVDLMSVSSHKVGGPRGIGALLVRRGLRIPPFILGGAQERARRGGLEDVAAAVGFAAAVGALDPGEARHASAHTDVLRSAALAIPGVSLYGPSAPADRLPHIVCLGVNGVEAEPVLIGLDQAGVAAHSGSSCSSETLEPSPVLAAMGVDAEHSLRLSVGWSTTDGEVAMAAEALGSVVGRLRRLGQDQP